MIALAVFAAPICAFLPNATVVILMGPLVVGLCKRMKIDFIEPMILLVFVANSSGLLTLVGDPATFIVGNAVGLSFTAYLRLLSPGGVLAIVVVLAMLPLVFRSIWRLRVSDQEGIVIPPIGRPRRSHPDGPEIHLSDALLLPSLLGPMNNKRGVPTSRFPGSFAGPPANTPGPA